MRRSELGLVNNLVLQKAIEDMVLCHSGRLQILEAEAGAGIEP